ncbi:MAG: hypothetical protein HYY23_08940 [Verrucomicrobia bacterium]|nr:hypothetical protein [Verrucomicrobiota bacterium]
MTRATIPTAGREWNNVNGVSATAREKRFDWPLCYDAENLVQEQIQAFLARNDFAVGLSERLRLETGTLMIDWVDNLVVSVDLEPRLRNTGFTDDRLRQTCVAGQRALWHPEAMLPRVIVDQAASGVPHPTALAIRVDSVSDFMTAHRIVGEPEGEPLSRFRRSAASVESGFRFEVVERRGYRGCAPEQPRPGQTEAFLKAQELWKTRRRVFEDDGEGFRHTHALLDRVIELVGCDVACHVVFAEERAYWERRNRAAQIQKGRQDRLGLGWANHDHHTFRSSRAHFVDLMRVLEKLGFERRERYYAGAQAGWGAQILEHPVEPIVAFCDVDLEPDETEVDFSRQLLPPSKRLGTIGLWVGLHGESFLEAGMHHLECRFDHHLVREQLASEGIATMKPFSDLPFLTQAFTEGERWLVRRERAERLRRAGLIDESQFRQFTKEGAIGSHLENLQRKGGFKGFNQKSVSVIIEATDPRRHAG